MSSDYYGFIAGEIADEGASGPPRDPDVCGAGYCGNCGIHLDEHGDRCNEYAPAVSGADGPVPDEEEENG